MERKCSVFGCRKGYKWTPKSYSNRKVRVFQFPIDEKEKESWVASLPNCGLSGNNKTEKHGCL